MEEKNKKEEISPATDEIEVEEKAVVPPVGGDDMTDETDKTMKAILQAVQKMASHQVLLGEKISRIEKEYPPKDAIPAPGGVEYNSTEEPVKNYRHTDSYVKPVSDTTKDVQMLKAEDIEKMLAKLVETKMSTLVKASTPRPYSGRPEDELYTIAKSDPIKAIRLAVAHARRSAGGHYNSEDSFGFKSGSGNKNVWKEQQKFFSKMFNRV